MTKEKKLEIVKKIVETIKETSSKNCVVTERYSDKNSIYIRITGFYLEMIDTDEMKKIIEIEEQTASTAYVSIDWIKKKIYADLSLFDD